MILNKKYRVNIIILIVMLTASLFLNITRVQASENIEIIEINRYEDLLQLSKDCIVDTYSRNKKVILNSDIEIPKNLNEEDKFHGIPIFLGTFDGNNHTISGIDFQYSGQGFFYILESSAKVYNLHIDGVISINIDNIGGIASQNKGTIENCSFEGIISANSYVGGIVGRNFGTIINCTVNGNIFGLSQVGGIAGENKNSIIHCSNYATINTENKENNIITYEHIDIDLNLPEQTHDDITDVGGIAGVNDAVIQNGRNFGIVGYQQIGYNIGGIAGKHSGYIADSINDAYVYGRKDVGGIVGQFEPSVVNVYSKSKLEILKDELDVLKNLTTNLGDRTKNSNYKINSSINDLNNSIDTTREHTDSLFDKSLDIIDNNIESLNTISLTVAESLDDMVFITDSVDVAIDDLEEFASSLEGFSIELKNAFEELEKLSEVESDVRNHLTRADEFANSSLISLEDSIDYFNELSQYTFDGLDDINTHLSFTLEYFQYFLNALGNTSSELGNLGGIQNNASNSLGSMNSNIQNIISDLEKALSIIIALDPNDSENFYTNLSAGQQYLRNAISSLNGAIYDFGSALNSLGGASDILGNSNNNLQSALQYAFYTTGSLNDTIYFVDLLVDDVSPISNMALSELSTAVNQINIAREEFGNAYEATEAFSVIFENTNDYVQKSLDNSSEAFSKLESSFSNMGETNDMITDFFTKYSEKEEVVFYGSNDDYDYTKDLLSKSLEEVSSSIELVNNSFSLAGDNFIDDIELINQQTNKIFNIVIEMMQEVTNFSDDSMLTVHDISYEESKDITEGKVTTSTNNGSIQGDINIGGIVGAISFEVTFDPEDDLKLLGSAGEKLTRYGVAVVSYSNNYGYVTSKKDCVGGIVGLQEFGLISDSSSNSKIESTAGNFVGGIVGKSNSLIYNCFSKNTLFGNNNIGGVAGYGYIIKNCYSLTSYINGKNFLGGIVGEIDDDSDISNNYFVGDIGGIENISYGGRAENISYEQLINVENIPSYFNTMQVDFYIDDKLVHSKKVDYNTDIEINDFLDIPQKYGYYTEWDLENFDYQNIKSDWDIHLKYLYDVTTIGNEDENNSVATVLIDGVFVLEDVLQLEKYNGEFLPLKNPETETLKEEFTIFVENSNSDIEKLRYYNPDNNKLDFYVLINNKWQIIEMIQEGKYLVSLDEYNFPQYSHFRVVELNNNNYLLFKVFIIVFLVLILSKIYFYKSKKHIKM